MIGFSPCHKPPRSIVCIWNLQVVEIHSKKAQLKKYVTCGSNSLNAIQIGQVDVVNYLYSICVD